MDIKRNNQINKKQENINEKKLRGGHFKMIDKNILKKIIAFIDDFVGQGLEPISAENEFGLKFLQQRKLDGKDKNVLGKSFSIVNKGGFRKKSYVNTINDEKSIRYNLQQSYRNALFPRKNKIAFEAIKIVAKLTENAVCYPYIISCSKEITNGLESLKRSNSKEFKNIQNILFYCYCAYVASGGKADVLEDLTNVVLGIVKAEGKNREIAYRLTENMNVLIRNYPQIFEGYLPENEINSIKKQELFQKLHEELSSLSVDLESGISFEEDSTTERAAVDQLYNIVVALGCAGINLQEDLGQEFKLGITGKTYKNAKFKELWDAKVINKVLVRLLDQTSSSYKGKSSSKKHSGGSLSSSNEGSGGSSSTVEVSSEEIEVFSKEKVSPSDQSSTAELGSSVKPPVVVKKKQMKVKRKRRTKNVINPLKKIVDEQGAKIILLQDKLLKSEEENLKLTEEVERYKKEVEKFKKLLDQARLKGSVKKVVVPNGVPMPKVLEKVKKSDVVTTVEGSGKGRDIPKEVKKKPSLPKKRVVSKRPKVDVEKVEKLKKDVLRLDRELSLIKGFMNQEKVKLDVALNVVQKMGCTASGKNVSEVLSSLEQEIQAKQKQKLIQTCIDLANTRGLSKKLAKAKVKICGKRVPKDAEKLKGILGKLEIEQILEYRKWLLTWTEFYKKGNTGNEFGLVAKLMGAEYTESGLVAKLMGAEYKEDDDDELLDKKELQENLAIKLKKPEEGILKKFTQAVFYVNDKSTRLGSDDFSEEYVLKLSLDSVNLEEVAVPTDELASKLKQDFVKVGTNFNRDVEIETKKKMEEFTLRFQQTKILLEKGMEELEKAEKGDDKEQQIKVLEEELQELNQKLSQKDDSRVNLAQLISQELKSANPDSLKLFADQELLVQREAEKSILERKKKTEKLLENNRQLQQKLEKVDFKLGAEEVLKLEAEVLKKGGYTATTLKDVQEEVQKKLIEKQKPELINICIGLANNRGLSKKLAKAKVKICGKRVPTDAEKLKGTLGKLKIEQILEYREWLLTWTEFYKKGNTGNEFGLVAKIMGADYKEEDDDELLDKKELQENLAVKLKKPEEGTLKKFTQAVFYVNGKSTSLGSDDFSEEYVLKLDLKSVNLEGVKLPNSSEGFPDIGKETVMEIKRIEQDVKILITESEKVLKEKVKRKKDVLSKELEKVKKDAKLEIESINEKKQKQLLNIKSKKEEAEKKIESAKTKLIELKKSRDEFNVQISGLKKRIGEIELKLSELKPDEMDMKLEKHKPKTKKVAKKVKKKKERTPAKPKKRKPTSDGSGVLGSEVKVSKKKKGKSVDVGKIPVVSPKKKKRKKKIKKTSNAVVVPGPGKEEVKKHLSKGDSSKVTPLKKTDRKNPPPKPKRKPSKVQKGKRTDSKQPIPPKENVKEVTVEQIFVQVTSVEDENKLVALVNQHLKNIFEGLKTSPEALANIKRILGMKAYGIVYGNDGRIEKSVSDTLMSANKADEYGSKLLKMLELNKKDTIVERLQLLENIVHTAAIFNHVLLTTQLKESDFKAVSSIVFDPNELDDGIILHEYFGDGYDDFHKFWAKKINEVKDSKGFIQVVWSLFEETMTGHMEVNTLKAADEPTSWKSPLTMLKNRADEIAMEKIMSCLVASSKVGDTKKKNACIEVLKIFKNN